MRNGKLGLSTAEVAELSGRSKVTITSLIRAGKLKATNVAVGDKKPRWFIPMAAFNEFFGLDAGSQPVPQEEPRKRTSRSKRIDDNVPKVFG